MGLYFWDFLVESIFWWRIFFEYFFQVLTGYDVYVMGLHLARVSDTYIFYAQIILIALL